MGRGSVAGRVWEGIGRRPALWAWLAVAGLTLLTAYLRWRGLGSRGFWRDEAQCIFIAQKAFPAGIINALLHEAHPPLYYALQHFWIGLAGWSELRIRLLSAGFGVLYVPTLFLAGRRFFGIAAGLGAALFGAVAPLHIAVSQTARGYSLLALLALLSVWFLYEAWERGGVWWPAYVVVTAGALYTHNWALFLVVAQNGFALWQMWREASWRRRMPAWVATQLAVGLLYLPWAFILLRQIKTVQVLPFVPVPSPLATLSQLGRDLFGGVPGALLALALIVLAFLPARRWLRAVPAAGPLGLAVWCSCGALALGLLVSLRTYGQVPSYVALVTFPAWCLLLGWGLSRLRPAPAALAVAALVVVVSLASLGDMQFMFKSTLREIAWTVQEQAGAADVIVVAPDYLATTFNTYYRGPQPQVAFPWNMGRQEEIDCVGWNDRWREAAAAVPATLDEVERRLGPGGRLWLIAALDDYPDERVYYEQVRRLKGELDTRYALTASLERFRNAPEWADVYVYSRR